MLMFIPQFIFFSKCSNQEKLSNNMIETTTELELIKTSKELKYNRIRQNRFLELEGLVWNILINENNVILVNKILDNSGRLGELSKINRGLITGDRKKFFAESQINEFYQPIFSGSDVHRYYTNKVSEYVYFIRPVSAGGCWDDSVHLSRHKILIRQIGTKPTATIINDPIAVTGNVFTIMSKSFEFEKYILAVINSKLIQYFWFIMFSDFKNSFPQVTIFSLNFIPIKENPKDNEFKEIIKLVDQLLHLNKEKQEVKLQSRLEQIQSKIDYCESRIDQLVYQLYGLTEEEIKIVESEK